MNNLTLEGILALVLVALLGCICVNYHQYGQNLVLYLTQRLMQTYFYGYSLDQVVGERFFWRYRKFVDIGFCAAVSSLMMFALKDNPTARIVRGYWREDGKKCYHSWAEFRLHGIWLVLDPCWLGGFPCMLRAKYRLRWRIRVSSVCKYDEFWALEISQKFYQKLQEPESSFLFYELFMAYGWLSGHETDSLVKCTENFQLDDEAGLKTSRGVAIYYDEWMLSKRIFSEFMAKPTRKQPKAHTVRRYRAIRKKIRQGYHQFLLEEYGDANCDPSALL